MKNSLRKQLTVSFICALVFVMALGAIANTLLLSGFYRQRKVNILVSYYERLNSELTSGSFYSDSVKNELNRLCNASNLTMLIIDPSGANVYSSAPNAAILKNRLFEHVLPYDTESPDLKLPSLDNGSDRSDSDKPNGYNPDSGEKLTILKQTDKYEIDLISDKNADSDYIEMWGKLYDDSSFVVRTPMTSIQESTQIANQFLAYIITIVIIIGTFIIWILAKRISEPIKELTILSSKMADLDFDVKYKSGGDNEIGILGENFNTMSETLENVINELQVANEKLKEDIKEQERINKVQSEFVSNVSHELKTPIALIQGYAEGLDDEICTDSESRKYYIDVIVDEASKMNRLVKELLTLDMMEKSDESELSEFNLVELVLGVISRERTLHQDVKFKYQGMDEILVYSDPYKIEQVVINYINNAIAHNKGEYIIISINRDSQNKVVFGVFNEGDSIPKEESERIWDKFYKVDKAHSREYGGSGIGLSIVRAIMDSLGGEYGYENVDNGVRFFIKINK